MTDLTPGPRDELLTARLEAALADLDPALVDRLALDGVEGPRRLLLHLARAIEPALRALGEDRQAARQQAAAINALGHQIEGFDEEAVVLPPQVLRGLRRPAAGLEVPVEYPSPQTAFSTSDLLVGGVGQPNIGNELNAELRSATSVDLICAFVIWSGVTRLREAIADLKARGGRFRVITTTYMGATEARAVAELHRLGADVRIAYDARTTKLHAKAWLLERPGGLATAFVGSSNLSHTALFDGLEWNVRLSNVDVPHLIKRVRTMFETLWASDHFELYRDDDENRLSQALGGQRRQDQVSFVGLEVRPFDEQQRILDRLMLERLRHDRHRNLVVAATGTGKTVVAGLDYKQLRLHHGDDLSLLFVAHRNEILEQSRQTFRHVLRDGTFGELHGRGQRATGRHVFGMIQSLDADTVHRLDPEAYDVVIVDEFHHAKARSYARLLDHLRPKELLGLTATPERMDGQNVTDWFGGRIAYELRLWEAIDEGFLVPFQYFGIADDVDVSQVTWRRTGYDLEELSNVYTAEPLRVGRLLEAIQRTHPHPGAMRAFGFCVSVAHARFMAERFTAAGVASACIEGATPMVERRRLLHELAQGRLRAVFSVDVLGEGVDVPTVDTVLLLRPTDSATVFTQQLGRGLRRAVGKRYLTVIDLIGQQRREFRFDRRLRSLIDLRRGSVREQVEQGFPYLPSGCHVELDRQCREIVLDNLRHAAQLSTWPSLVADARELGAVSMLEYLEKTDRSVSDLYRGSESSWTKLRRDARIEWPSPVDAEGERQLLRAIRRLQHVDDPERTSFLAAVLSSVSAPDLRLVTERERRLLYMLHLSLWGTRSKFPDLYAGLAALWPHRAVRRELVEL